MVNEILDLLYSILILKMAMAKRLTNVKQENGQYLLS